MEPWGPIKMNNPLKGPGLGKPRDLCGQVEPRREHQLKDPTEGVSQTRNGPEGKLQGRTSQAKDPNQVKELGRLSYLDEMHYQKGVHSLKKPGGQHRWQV